MIAPASAESLVLDGFDDISGWNRVVSEGARLELAQDTGYTGQGMRLDFDFRDGVGFAVVHKAYSLSLPENYEFRFRLRGESPPNNFQFKLLDSKGNVWWFTRRDFVFPKEWRELTIKKRHLEFAWGPTGGTGPQDVVALEIAVTTGTIGPGSVWIDELSFSSLEPAHDYTLTPAVQASTDTPGHEPGRVIDHDPLSEWHSGPLAEDQWLQLDFLKNREYGGLVIDWDANDYATTYQVQISDDGEDWHTVYSVSSGNGGRDYVYLPDAESRYLRLMLQNSSRGKGYGIAELQVKSLDFSRSPNQFFEAIAQDSPRGLYPKYLYREASYWTIVGVNGDDKEGLLNEEGMLEVDKSSFSIEPFLYTDDRLITWNEVAITQDLAKGYLPIPTVTWRDERLILKITAFATGTRGASTLYVRYRVENPGKEYRHASLFLAIRPFQVNPPWQNLNTTGGVTPIHDISYSDSTVLVDRRKTVLSLTPAERFGASTFDQRPITDYLRHNRLPPQAEATDPFGYASGALEYRLDLAPGSAQEVYLAIPFHQNPAAVRTPLAPEQAYTIAREQLAQTTDYWEGKLNRVEIQLPRRADKIVDTLKSALAYILINRDGPAIQPGSRTYERSWIRDGALTSSALLSLGHTEEVREFIRWFANFQFVNGKIPCCVDARGADPTPENDSHGEFIYLVMEYYRHTHDIGFLIELWPHVIKAVGYIDSLRQQRLTETYKIDGYQGARYGLMPESISHEGYSAAPRHSYWDDFFTLRGLKDAADMANILGDEERTTAYAALRDAFHRDLYVSLARTIARCGIGYIPGCVELGDFDPTSTTIAIDPGGELADLPEPALRQTYDKYYEFFQHRRDGLADWNDYTPYELRIVGTLIRLGEKTRAHEMLDYFLADQRPAAWNQWPEIIWRDPKAPRFIGDLPHTWVGSDYIRSVRSLFAYERESDQALVIAAGIPQNWLNEGVTVKRLPTYHGTLNYTLRATAADEIRLRLSGDLSLPTGKIVLPSPLARPVHNVTVNGKEIATFTTDSILIDEFPAEVVIRY